MMTIRVSSEACSDNENGHMDAATVLIGQLKQARGFLEFATAGLDADQWHQRSAGSTIQSIASINRGDQSARSMG